MTYELDGEDVIEVRCSPALECAQELESMKGNGNALVAKQEWSLALAQYERCIQVGDERKETLSTDFEAERRAERCVLAALSNAALCTLKLTKYDKCKEICGAALERHKTARQPDESARAKVLFRRGQACLGLEDARSAVDSIAEAVEIEERLFGARGKKDAAVKLDDKAERQKVASIQAMKRELVKARKAVKVADKAASAKFSGAKGFLQAGKRGFSDPKTDRKEEIDRRLNFALEACFDPEHKGGEKFFEDQLAACVNLRHGACAAKDKIGELNATLAEGFIGFIAGEVLGSMRGKFASQTTAAWESYWYQRQYLEHDGKAEGETPLGADDLEPPLGLTDVVARECAAHSMMRSDTVAKALPHMLKYLELAQATGPLQAYHNLPDSFLLQRGMPKMDDKARRAWRWKHRSHSNRALFDGNTAVASIYQHKNDKAKALHYADQALRVATEPEEFVQAHRNLALLLGGDWRSDEAMVDEDDADASKAEGRIVAKAHEIVKPTAEEAEAATKHEAKAVEYEEKIRAKKAADDAKTKTMDDSQVPAPADEVPEEDEEDGEDDQHGEAAAAA